MKVDAKKCTIMRLRVFYIFFFFLNKKMKYSKYLLFRKLRYMIKLDLRLFMLFYAF